MISPDFPGKPPDRGSSGSSSDEDAALWDYVTKDVKPLPRQNLAPRATAKKPSVSKGARVGLAEEMAGEIALEIERAGLGRAALAGKSVGGASSNAALDSPFDAGGREVDRRTAQKLKRGRYEIDVRVDLHGLTQAAAHHKLTAVLLKAYARQQRCVLVITGKGSREAGTGVIKRAVPGWLQGLALREIVLRVEPAQPEHGGAGALYVLLRRKRTSLAELEN